MIAATCSAAHQLAELHNVLGCGLVVHLRAGRLGVIGAWRSGRQQAAVGAHARARAAWP
jgi:hypothetical protein